MLPIPANTHGARPLAGQPPRIDLEAAASQAPRPGRFPMMCGGFVAAFATTSVFGMGLPHGHFGGVIALAFSVGMCGGWIIREAGESAWRKAVTQDAWGRYHSRRAMEFRRG